MIPDTCAAIDAVLGVWADDQNLPVAWENVPFTPPDGPYLAAYDMPATAYSIDLASECRVYPGVYQINVVVPVGTGRATARALVRQVIEQFPEGRQFDGDGFTAWVHTPPSALPGIRSGTAYTIPISFTYRAHVAG